ncbi:uncharacterized protein ARMOST_03339 [Armillaria ostoyae]|uniref:Uncharacterized protein n=1 Tax=Armillaria ostoyae TaxID=47428 RepID=A0A284QU99_ARMOS|nr:uncharacterized protein ARMOST_03339 [Armillaria ostoyae]
MSNRLRTLALYKELRRLGKDYPDPSYDFKARVRRMFEKIEKAIKFGEYIKEETLALYSLRKYRHLKRMYPDSIPGPGKEPPMT